MLFFKGVIDFCDIFFTFVKNEYTRAYIYIYARIIRVNLIIFDKIKIVNE